MPVDVKGPDEDGPAGEEERQDRQPRIGDTRLNGRVSRTTQVHGQLTLRARKSRGVYCEEEQYEQLTLLAAFAAGSIEPGCTPDKSRDELNLKMYEMAQHC